MIPHIQPLKPRLIPPLLCHSAFSGQLYILISLITFFLSLRPTLVFLNGFLTVEWSVCLITITHYTHTGISAELPHTQTTAVIVLFRL